MSFSSSGRTWPVAQHNKTSNALASVVWKKHGGVCTDKLLSSREGETSKANNNERKKQNKKNSRAARRGEWRSVGWNQNYVTTKRSNSSTQQKARRSEAINCLSACFFFSAFFFLAACLDLVELAGEAHEVDRGGVGQRGHHRPVEPENALVAYVEMRRRAPEVRDGQVAGPPVEPQHLSARQSDQRARSKKNTTCAIVTRGDVDHEGMKRGGGSRSEGHADKMVTTRPIGMACQSHPDRNIWAVAREREIREHHGVNADGERRRDKQCLQLSVPPGTN